MQAESLLQNKIRERSVPRKVYLHFGVMIVGALLPLIFLRIFLGTGDSQSAAYGFAGVEPRIESVTIESSTSKDEPTMTTGSVITAGLTVTDAQVYTSGLTVKQGLTVTGELTVTHGLTVTGAVVVSGTLIVTDGLTMIAWNNSDMPQVEITGSLTVMQNQVSMFRGGLRVTGDLIVNGALTVLDRLMVTGDVTIAQGRLIVTRKYSAYLPMMLYYITIQADNGSFELGPVRWGEFSTTGQRLIRSVTELEVPPYAGQWAARLGNRDNEISMISQGVALSKGNACLVYWQWTASDDVCDADYGGVGINGKWTTEVHPLCAGTATAKWVQIKVDLSEYITTARVLNFAATNDYSVPSTMYVDDIVFHPTSHCHEDEQTALRPAGVLTDSVAWVVGQPISVTQRLTSK
jgi:cytoskeletal protein CcmA (bactofilin family)